MRSTLQEQVNINYKDQNNSTLAIFLLGVEIGFKKHEQEKNLELALQESLIMWRNASIR